MSSGSRLEVCDLRHALGEAHLQLREDPTDDGGPLFASCLKAFIAGHPELEHLRTRVRTEGQNGSGERGLPTCRHERLFMEQIENALMLARHLEEHRRTHSELRPHEALAWSCPAEVHRGPSDPTRPHLADDQPLRASVRSRQAR